MKRILNGHIDLLTADLIEGWLAWPLPGPPELDVMCDTRLIGHCTADHRREDLIAAGIGERAFTFLVPLEITLAPLEAVRLRLAGTPLYLLPDATTRYST